MKTFETPQPIAVKLEIGVGNVTFVASERSDTTVEVRASRPNKRDDVSAAENTTIEYVGGRLLVRAPKSWRRHSWFSDGGSVDVHIELPEGSEVTAGSTMAPLRAIGQLGMCHFTTGMGEIDVSETAQARLRTGYGAIHVGRVAGDASLVTGSGDVRVGEVEGIADIKTSNGGAHVERVGGDIQVKTANGEIVIDEALAGVVAKTANGAIRLGRVSRGSVVAATAVGAVEIGISTGTAAWLELHTGFGEVVSELDPADEPGPGAEVVQVRARTSYGDITIHRRSASPAATAEKSLS